MQSEFVRTWFLVVSRLISILTTANRFDLVIGTNVFLYYDPFDQMLALENTGAMLKPEGIVDK